MKTGVNIKTGFFPLAWFLYFVKPTIEINGTKQIAEWGESFFELSPGKHRIRIYFSYLGNPECGANETIISIEEDDLKRIVYYMPPWIFAKGSIKVS